MALRSKSTCPCGCGETVTSKDDAVKAYARITDGWSAMQDFETRCDDLMAAESVAVLRRSISRAKDDLEAHLHGTARPTVHPEVDRLEREIDFWESRWQEHLSSGGVAHV